jgi:hypothetical protein
MVCSSWRIWKIGTQVFIIANDVQPSTRDLLIEQARESLLKLEEDLKDIAHSAPQYAVSLDFC